MKQPCIVHCEPNKCIVHCQSSTEQVHCNAMMTPKQVRQYCQLDEQSDKLLQLSMEKMGLSARAYDRILKVARTIADLDGDETIAPPHLAEAIQYRTVNLGNRQ